MEFILNRQSLTHQEIILRQRRKFLSAFISEGKAKSSPNLKNTNNNNANKIFAQNNSTARDLHKISNKTSKSNLDLHNRIRNSSTDKINNQVKYCIYFKGLFLNYLPKIKTKIKIAFIFDISKLHKYTLVGLCKYGTILRYTLFFFIKTLYINFCYNVLYL